MSEEEKVYYEKLAFDLRNNKWTMTLHESKVVCPYCGCVQDDSDYELVDNGSGETYCDRCGKEFDYEADIEITYSTFRKN